MIVPQLWHIVGEIKSKAQTIRPDLHFRVSKLGAHTSDACGLGGDIGQQETEKGEAEEYFEGMGGWFEMSGVFGCLGDMIGIYGN